MSFKEIKWNWVRFRSKGKLHSLTREWGGVSSHSRMWEGCFIGVSQWGGGRGSPGWAQLCGSSSRWRCGRSRSAKGPDAAPDADAAILYCGLCSASALSQPTAHPQLTHSQPSWNARAAISHRELRYEVAGARPLPKQPMASEMRLDRKGKKKG